jgi:hypothetical protein
VRARPWQLIRFRHFIDGSLALASLNLACRYLVPAFPQRSPPLLLTTAACGGLRSTPDCRPRRALLHLSYSCAPSYSDGARDTRPMPAILSPSWICVRLRQRPARSALRWSRWKSRTNRIRINQILTDDIRYRATKDFGFSKGNSGCARCRREPDTIGIRIGRIETEANSP